MLKNSQVITICASHFTSISDMAGFSSFATWAKQQNLTKKLKTDLYSLNALKLLRQLNRDAVDMIQPEVVQDGETVLLAGKPIGKLVIWYRTALPQEAQARIAYESLLDRFLGFLAYKYKIIALDVNELNAWLFVPDNAPSDLRAIWLDFVQIAFSRKELEKNFILLMNSLKLANRGFGGIEFPVITKDMGEMQAAFYLATLEQKVTFGSPEYKQAAKEKDTEKKTIAIKNNHKVFVGVVEEMAKEVAPDVFKRVQELAINFNGTARNQFLPTVKPRTFNPKPESTTDCIEDRVVRFANTQPNFELPCILKTESESLGFRIAGDRQGNICYACGRPLEDSRDNKARSKAPKLTANRFILASPSQRLQSGNGQEQPTVCRSCTAIAMISPIKLTDNNLVVRLGIGSDDGFEEQDYLRMMTLGELNLTAGKYLLIKCTEMVSDKGGKAPVSDKMGALQYALFKIATILPRETLRNSRAWLFDGSEQELPVRRMVWLNYLQEIFRLRLVANDDKPNRATFEAIRLVQKEEVIKAIYALVSADSSQVTQLTDHSFESLRLLEELRQAHCTFLEEANMPEKAKMFRDIAAMTGLLDAFCDYVRSEATKGGKSAENEVEKLIEEVTDPFQFIYRASHNLSGTMATMFRNDDNYFCFDSARNLMAKLVGDDMQKREGVSEKGTRSLRIYFDDVRNAYVTLFETDYKTEKEQKDFTTELKLSLAAKFPEYYTKKEK